MSDSRSTSVSRQFQEERNGSGPSAVVKSTATETKTYPDGKKCVTTTVTETTGCGPSATTKKTVTETTTTPNGDTSVTIAETTSNTEALGIEDSDPSKADPSTDQLGNEVTHTENEKLHSNLNEEGGVLILREIRTETKGTGVNAVVNTIETETTTDPNGNRSVKTTKTVGCGSAGNLTTVVTKSTTGPDGTTCLNTTETATGHVGMALLATEKDERNQSVTNLSSDPQMHEVLRTAEDAPHSSTREQWGTSSTRHVRTETTGSGPSAIVKTIETETTTEESGKKFVRTTETVRSGTSAVVQTTVTETTIGPDGETLSTKTKKTTGPEVGTSEKTNETTSADAFSTSTMEALDIKKVGRPIETNEEFINSVIANHNKYRAIHGEVAPLRHNTELTAFAQNWAEHLASAGKLSHSDGKYKGEELGENCAKQSSSGPVDYPADALVNKWYSESSNYDYSQPEGKPGVCTGHFTQVVWKGSQEVGVGKAFSSDGHHVFVVCNYYPAGNVLGHFQKNVSPPK